MKQGHFIEGISHIRPETKYKNSRFDFYVEAGERRIFIEVKGVTLEEKGVALFPDAPTERGVKHLNELIACLSEGYEAIVVFIVQMKGVKHFTPNTKTHLDFGKTLKLADEKGVGIAAFDCFVSENDMLIQDEVSVVL